MGRRPERPQMECGEQLQKMLLYLQQSEVLVNDLLSLHQQKQNSIGA